MRIAIDPVPVVLGIYAYVSDVLGQAVGRRAGEDAASLGKRYGGKKGPSVDREIQKLTRALHADVKTADKLLKKTADVWKISAETDLVELVVQARGEGPDPQAYVLLRPAEIRAVLASIGEAARGAGEGEETIAQLEEAADALPARSTTYLAFGFDPWGV